MTNITELRMSDVNEHTLITKVVYPMINALESKLVANLQAVEPFWEEKYGQSAEGIQAQNRIMLKRYLQQTKVRIHSLSGQINSTPDATSIYFPAKDFSEVLQNEFSNFLTVCNMFENQYVGFSFGDFYESAEISQAKEKEPLYFASPFTLIQPNLKGNYNQSADFGASEILTVSEIQGSNPLFDLSGVYLKGVSWETLYPEMSITEPVPEIWDAVTQTPELLNNDLLQKVIPDRVKQINIYKLLTVKDDGGEPQCPTSLDGLRHSRSFLFKLSFLALPTVEGYRIAPAHFVAFRFAPDKSGGRELLNIIHRLNNREAVAELINNYERQGLLNWINL